MKTYQVCTTETKTNVVTILADDIESVKAALCAKAGIPVAGTESLETTTTIMEVTQPKE